MLVRAILLASSFMASGAVASEAHFTCTSIITGDQILISQPEDGSEAHVLFHDIDGAATVAHGLDGVTFIHIASNEVWTLTLHFPTMKYELSTHGSENLEDHGSCIRDGE